MRFVSGALAIFLCAVAGAAQHKDDYQGGLLGKTRAQVLGMGRDKWIQYVDDQAGPLRRNGITAADDTFTECIEWQNARLRKGIPEKILNVMADTLYRYKLIVHETTAIEFAYQPGNWYGSKDQWGWSERVELESKLLPQLRDVRFHSNPSQESQKDLNQQSLALASKLNAAIHVHVKDWTQSQEPESQNGMLSHADRLLQVVKKLLDGLDGLPLGSQRTIVRTANDDLTSIYNTLNGK